MGSGRKGPVYTRAGSNRLLAALPSEARKRRPTPRLLPASALPCANAEAIHGPDARRSSSRFRRGWGVPYLLIKVAVQELTPASLVFLRTTIGALLLLPGVMRRGDLRALLPRWRPILLFTPSRSPCPGGCCPTPSDGSAARCR